MDDAMRCDRCRQEVTYQSVQVGEEHLCEDCVNDMARSLAAAKAALAERESLAYGGLLAKLHAIQDAVGGRDVDVVDVLHSHALAMHDESTRRVAAEAQIALIRERWSEWQKVRVMGICMGERMRLPGAAPDAIIDALDEACQG
jgi:hypothetical protein